MTQLARNVAVKAARERQDEGHDVRRDVFVEDAALIGDDDRVLDELRVVEAGRRRNGWRLQPLQLACLAQHVGRQGPEGGVGIDDLLARLVGRFGDDHVEGGRPLRERGRPAAGDLALGWQKHKLGHR